MKKSNIFVARKIDAATRFAFTKRQQDSMGKESGRSINRSGRNKDERS